MSFLEEIVDDDGEEQFLTRDEVRALGRRVNLRAPVGRSYFTVVLPPGRPALDSDLVAVFCGQLGGHVINVRMPLPEGATRVIEEHTS